MVEGAEPGPSCHTDMASAISAEVTVGVASTEVGGSASGVGVDGRGMNISPLMNAYIQKAKKETVLATRSGIQHRWAWDSTRNVYIM